MKWDTNQASGDLEGNKFFDMECLTFMVRDIIAVGGLRMGARAGLTIKSNYLAELLGL